MKLDEINEAVLNKKIAWNSVNAKLALKNTYALDLLREACLIESYLPIFTSRMSELFWDDIEATSIFTIEAIEAYWHYLVPRKYLEKIGYRPVSDKEIIALRRKDRKRVYSNKVKELVNFMGTEHFAAAFFKDLANIITEPILKDILLKFSDEEVTHSQFAFDLLDKMIKKDPKVKKEVIRRGLKYQHVGEYVMPQVSPAKKNNIKAIQSFNEKIYRLADISLSEAKVRKNTGLIR